MPIYTVVTQLYLGNFTELDTVESTGTVVDDDNELDNATNLSGGPNIQAGTTFLHTDMSYTTITQNDTVQEGVTTRLEEDDLPAMTNGQQLSGR